MQALTCCYNSAGTILRTNILYCLALGSFINLVSDQLWVCILFYNRFYSAYTCHTLQLSTGVLIGQLCSCHGAGVYNEMKECILSGIRDNIDRDTSSANEELMHKLSSRHDSTGDGEGEIERVSVLL